MESLNQNEANVEATAYGDESPFVDDALGVESEQQVSNTTNEEPVLTEESEARKFQSMYDRSQAELQNLKKLIQA